MHNKGTSQGNNLNVPVAFVEFQDILTAASAMTALQGKFLLSSDRGAIRIEFAKSKMAADTPHHYYQTYLQPREVCRVIYFFHYFSLVSYDFLQQIERKTKKIQSLHFSHNFHQI